MQEGVRVTTVGEKRSMLNRAEECSLDEFYFFFFLIPRMLLLSLYLLGGCAVLASVVNHSKS